MENSKFIRLYRALSAKEQMAFERFVNGMYGGQTLAMDVLKYIHKNFLKTLFQESDKELIINEILKQKTVSKQQRKNVDNLLGKLYGYLKEFLVWKKLSSQKEEIDFLMLDILQEKKVDKLLFQDMVRLENKLEKTKVFDVQNALRLFQLYHQKFYHPKTSKINTKNKDLPKAMENLDHFYVSMKLKLATELINRGRVLQEQHSISLLHSTIEFANDEMRGYPVIELWLLTIELLEKENEDLFRQLKNKVCHPESTVKPLDKLIFLSYLINFASSQIKKRNFTYYQAAYDLYVFGIEEKLLLKNGYFSPTKFNNIVRIACVLKKFTWIEQFISEWGKFLPSNYQQAVVQISNAYILFEQRKFNQTLETIAHLSFDDPYIELRARTLMLKSYFELYQFSNKHLILDYCKSFDNFLRRNLVVNQVTVASYRALIQFIRKMLHKKLNFKAVNNWYQQVPYIFSKFWIEEKIYKLKMESSSLNSFQPEDSNSIQK